MKVGGIFVHKGDNGGGRETKGLLPNGFPPRGILDRPTRPGRSGSLTPRRLLPLWFEKRYTRFFGTYGAPGRRVDAAKGRAGQEAGRHRVKGEPAEKIRAHERDEPDRI